MELTILDEHNNTSLSNQVRYTKSLATLATSSPLDLVESKLVFQILTQIGYKDTQFKPYSINASELHNEIKYFEKSRKAAKKKKLVSSIDDKIINKSDTLFNFTTNFRPKGFRLPRKDNKKGWISLPWFSKFEYDEDNDILLCTLSEDLKPYLLDFKEHWKKAYLTNILQFKSKYSHKFYLLLKTARNKDYISIDKYGTIIPISWIREWLGLTDEDYTRYANFKARVLLTVQEELKEKTEVTYELEYFNKKKEEAQRGIEYIRLKSVYKKENSQNHIDETPTMFEYDDIQDMEYDLNYFIERNRRIMYNKGVHYIQDIYLNDNKKYEVKTDRTIIKFTHKNKEKLIDELKKYSIAYQAAPIVKTKY